MTPQENLRRALLNDEFPDDAPEDRLFSPTGTDALRQNRNIALSAWMTQVSGQDINAGSPTWQQDKDALVQGFFKNPTASNVSDDEIHGLVRSHIQTTEEAATMAADGALIGEALPSVLSAVRGKRGASQLRPIFDRYEQDAMRRHTALSIKLAPYRNLVNQVSGELKKEMESEVPTTDKLESMAERLLSVNPADRPLVLKAIGATGGKDAKERASYLSKLAGAMGRMAETMGGSVVSAMSQASMAETEASLIEAGQTEFAGRMAKESERQRDFDLLTQQIRTIADQEIDPIKGDAWYSQLGIDVARMIPQSAVTIANPALGMAANWAYFENTIAGEAMLQDPRLTPQQARSIAGVSAPLNAAVETVTALIPFGRIKLPFIQKWLQATATSLPTTAARFGVRAAVGTAAEIGEEYIQAWTPLKAQELLGALQKDMPAVDWENRMPKFADIAAQTWGPALVFSLVGAGSVSISEVNSGRALANDVDLMVAQGLAPAKAQSIATAAESNNWQQVDSLFREDFVKPEKATDTEKEEATQRYLAKIQAHQEVETINAKEAENLGVRVFRDSQGWKVETAGGNVINADSAEASRRIRDDIRTASTEYEAETMTALVDDIVALQPQIRVELRPEVATATSEGIEFTDPVTGKTTKISDAKSFQNLRDQAEAIGGNQAESVRLILGDNYFEFGEGIARVFRRARGTEAVPQAITAAHEVIENSFRRGLLAGQWTESDARNAIGSLLPALESGITRLGAKATAEERLWLDNAKRAVAEGDSNLVREVISEMGVRTWIGRDRDGNKTGLRPGTILRALDAAILQEAKPENVTTYQRLRAWFKAVGAYLKGVVATAKIIRDAERNGTIDDFTGFLDKVLGIETATREENEVKDGVIDMAFSLAPEMQSRAKPQTIAPVTEMPDGFRLVGPSTFSIQAYHGTPHKFKPETKYRLTDGREVWLVDGEDVVPESAVEIGKAPAGRMRLSKMGTGEGAQAYGWGGYAAENKGVAGGYRSALGGRGNFGFPDGDSRAGIAILLARGENGEDLARKAYGNLPDFEALLKDAKVAVNEKSNIYTVELLPDADEFLDWDKPMGKQSKKVKGIIQAWIETLPADLKESLEMAANEEFDLVTGSQLYRIVKRYTSENVMSPDAADMSGDQEASMSLAKAGIPGIRYLDGGSRGAGEGTSNYVIFDENLVRILEENSKPVGSTFSLAPTEQDREHLAAVKAGDMETAQRLVDEAAKAAGYDSPRLYHGTGAEFTSFDKKRGGSRTDAQSARLAIFFTDDEKTAGAYAVYAAEDGPVKDALKKAEDAENRGDWDAYDKFIQEAESLENYDEVLKRRENAKVVSVYLKGDFLTFDAKGKTPQELSDGDIDKGITAQLKAAQRKGKTGVLFKNLDDAVNLSNRPSNHYAVFNPNQIKSADPVTRDESGQVIPLSQRFNPETPDIRFSLSPQSGIDIVSDTLESWQDVFDKAAKRNPARAMAIRDLAQQRINRLGEMWAADRWTAKGDKIRAVVEKRTKGGLDDEQAMREALRYQELLDAGMMTLTPDVLMAYSEGVGTLEKDPIISTMLNDNGKLMSKSEAARQGLPIKDLYDDAVWLPPQFYAKGGGIMPDVMANNLGFDTASEMWAALESSIKSHRSAKEGYAKAESAVKAAEQQAREQAKAEAAAWRQEADDMQADDWSPRESLVRDMRVLNVALSAFPPEVRAKITGGSMVKLAGLATERARYKAIQKALEKAIVETEVFMRKEYTEQVDEALDSYRSQKDSSGRISGKLPSQYTELVDYAYRIREASIEDQATESGGLEKALEESESDQQTQSVLTKMGILRLFEAWEMKDSTAMAAASEWLSETIENGKLGRKLLDEDRKAMLDDFRATAKKDAVPEGKISKVDVDNETNNVRFKVFRRAWQGLNGMLDSAVHTIGQRLELVFGENSKITDHFITLFIQAANASNDIKRDVNRKYHDMLSVVFNSRSRLAHARGIGQMQKVKASGIMITEGRVVEETKLDIETLTKLADGTMTAEAAGLRQDQVDDALEEFAANSRKGTVTVETVKNTGEQKERQMTELQGLQWWLWSRQDASRKQMERDGWTDESFAQLDAFLSPEAKALGEWIAKGYDDAARLIDPVYRRLFRAPLPRVKNYAPIYRNRSGDASVMDLDASDISSGLSAGFTKSRVNTVSPLAEMDAVTVMLTHWENVAHWVTHAEAVRDAKAVLLDRDVMTAIKQSSGTVSANSIKQRIAAIESQGTNAARELVDLSRMWRWIMQYRAFKGLAFRISPIIKQTPALLNPLLADVPAHAYTTGLARAFYDPEAFGRDVAEMFKSDAIMRRIEGGFSAEARIATQGEGAVGSVALAWMQRGMMPMAWTDGGWTALGAAVSYDYYRRGYMSENPKASTAMADAYATRKLEKMIATSAQPSDIVNRSLIEASSNPFMRSLWMFASDQRKALGIEVTALKKLLSGKSKNKAMDVQRIIVAHVAQAAMSQLMAAWMASLIGDDDDKEREWSREQWTLSLSLGPINGLFVFGRLVDMAGRRILGLRVFPGGNLIEKAADDLVRGGKSMDELFNPDDPEDFINALDALSVGASGVMSMGIGPQAGVVDVTANLVREGNKVIKAMSDKK